MRLTLLLLTVATMMGCSSPTSPQKTSQTCYSSLQGYIAPTPPQQVCSFGVCGTIPGTIGSPGTVVTTCY